MRTAVCCGTFLALALTARADDAPPTAEEQKTVAALAKLKIRATVEADLPKDARVLVTLDPAADAQLAAVRKHPNVGGLKIGDASRLSEAALTGLKDLPNLQKLVVQGGGSDRVLSAASNCPTLRHLALIYTAGPGVTDAGVTNYLKKLPRLETLDLSQNKAVTDRGMATVATLERLEKLYLAGTSVTDKGLFELKPLEGLRTLDMRSSRVTGKAADKFVDEMPNLRVVRY
jgi:hypothetical protein